MSNIDEAIEQLRCAEINCDNATKTGQPVFVHVVKKQVQEALKLLEDANNARLSRLRLCLRLRRRGYLARMG
jgi:hypothetical protein